MRDSVLLLDVDNTLLDNDRLIQDLRRHLREFLGRDTELRYIKILEGLRAAQGYVDYLGALQRYRLERPAEPQILRASSYLINYPFKKRLFPGALDAIRACSRWTTPVILSDGDAVFQPHKVMKSGLWNAVKSRVLIFVHKEKMLKVVERLYPARRYVMVDDKLRILQAIKKYWRSRVTTVFIRQGHYAHDPKILKKYSPADLTIPHIRDLTRAI